jgi:type IV fimbrial biogenesis protein FimT
MRGFSTQFGFSFAEVLVTAAIASATFAVAVPQMAGVWASVRLRSGMYAITAGLRLTRDEAIRRNGRVVMCKSGDGRQCTATGDWSQGWIIFHDPDNSGKVSSSEMLLYREPALTASLRVSGNTEIKDYVSYSSYGKARQLNGGFQAGTFTVCSKNAGRTDAYQVVFGILGRPRVQKTVVESCA